MPDQLKGIKMEVDNGWKEAITQQHWVSTIAAQRRTNGPVWLNGSDARVLKREGDSPYGQIAACQWVNFILLQNSTLTMDLTIQHRLVIFFCKLHFFTDINVLCDFMSGSATNSCTFVVSISEKILTFCKLT